MTSNLLRVHVLSDLISLMRMFRVSLVGRQGGKGEQVITEAILKAVGVDLELLIACNDA